MKPHYDDDDDTPQPAVYVSVSAERVRYGMRQSKTFTAECSRDRRAKTVDALVERADAWASAPHPK